MKDILENRKEDDCNIAKDNKHMHTCIIYSIEKEQYKLFFPQNVFVDIYIAPNYTDHFMTHVAYV
jgi:hypothetical protein